MLRHQCVSIQYSWYSNPNPLFKPKIFINQTNWNPLAIKPKQKIAKEIKRETSSVQLLGKQIAG